jgi:hypothetical protein
MDAQLPSNAVDDLGPNDILIWTNENGSGCGDQRSSQGPDGFPSRPERFQPAGVCGNFDRLCPQPDGRDLGLPDMRAWWLAFQDADRSFYVFVGMGKQAFSDAARAQLAWDVLDSLRFLPR